MTLPRCIDLAARTLVAIGLVATAAVPASGATARTPGSDAEILAELPPGVRHETEPARSLVASRIDVALPLAELDIRRARETGDLRFLGYAEATLTPWMTARRVPSRVLVLHATLLQSRHDFDGSLAELERALESTPDDAQAWLTRATVLRVLGRYDEARSSCARLDGRADPAVASLCSQGIRGLSGELAGAYAAIAGIDAGALAPPLRAWRDSELGEMAERLGRDSAAERHFRAGLEAAPRDFYLRLAYADLLLRQGRARETLDLLSGPSQSMEPLLLRAAIAHRMLRDAGGTAVEGMLASAFDLEERRHEPVHRREQARFLLDVRRDPPGALAAALENWRVQREPDDLLILARAAAAAGQREAAAPARQFVELHHLEDARLRGSLTQPAAAMGGGP